MRKRLSRKTTKTSRSRSTPRSNRKRSEPGMESPRRRQLSGVVAAVAAAAMLEGCAALFPEPAGAAEGGAAAWHYEGAEGPANWGRLSPAFAACGTGRRQSPIDITNVSRGTSTESTSTFPPASLRIAHHEHVADGTNNGHTIQIDYAGAD